MTEAMKITVVIDVPADTIVTREGLIDILMSVPYEPDKAMMKPIVPGKGGKDRYTTGPFAGVKTKWFSEVSGNQPTSLDPESLDPEALALLVHQGIMPWAMSIMNALGNQESYDAFIQSIVSKITEQEG